MAAKQKFYVVWEGASPGIYKTWTECQLQIKGFPSAKYKSFKTLEEAQEAYSGQYLDHVASSTKKKKQNTLIPNLPKNSISVDAACSGNPGIMEYRGVWTDSQDEIFKQGPFKHGTNNIGEFLALVHALALLQKKGDSTTTIYSDSRTAMAWVRNKKVKTTLKRIKENEVIFNLIERAIDWLKRHTYKNPILKWDTKNWGEIPADFGRK